MAFIWFLNVTYFKYKEKLKGIGGSGFRGFSAVSIHNHSQLCQLCNLVRLKYPINCQKKKKNPIVPDTGFVREEPNWSDKGTKDDWNQG